MFPKKIHQGSYQRVMIFLWLVMLLAGFFNWNAVAQKGIVVDGKRNDWLGIQPIIDDSKDMKNERVNLDIKAVYAALEGGFLCLMIEIYGPPSSKSGYSFGFDVNDDDTVDYWTEFGNIHDFYHEEEVQISNRGKPFDVYDFRRLRIFEMSYFVGEVVEARVPLDYLGHPSVIVIRAKTNVWNLHPGQTLHRDYIDAACCGIIDLSLLRDEQPTRKNAGMGVITLFAGLAAAGGFMKRKK